MRAAIGCTLLCFAITFGCLRESKDASLNAGANGGSGGVGTTATGGGGTGGRVATGGASTMSTDAGITYSPTIVYDTSCPALDTYLTGCSATRFFCGRTYTSLPGCCMPDGKCGGAVDHPDGGPVIYSTSNGCYGRSIIPVFNVTPPISACDPNGAADASTDASPSTDGAADSSD